MATKFTFPKNPKIGDRIEIVSTSTEKLPINIVGNSEAGKTLTLVFPDQTYTGTADGSTTIATITNANVVYGFRCVSVASSHTWVMEDTCLKAMIDALTTRVSTLETEVASLETELATVNTTLSGLVE